MSLQPPTARRQPLVRSLHGVDRVDDYAWLREVASSKVLDHLAAERAYYDEATSGLRPRAEALYAEMAARLPPVETSARWERERYAYFTRTPESGEHAHLCRVERGRSPDADEHDSTVLLDPTELAGGSPHVDLGVCEVSPDETVLAYSVDTTGAEVYELRFRDLDAVLDLPDRLPGVAAGGAWADSATFFYLRVDAAWRPYQVWRHTLGTPTSEDVCVFTEPDGRFEVSVRRCRSGGMLVIHVASAVTSEEWLVDPSAPRGEPRLVEGRRQGVEYAVEHVAAGPDGGWLFLVTNDGATEFRLMRTPLADPDREHWQEVVGERPSERLGSVEAFESHVVLSLRRDSVPLLRILPLDQQGDLLLSVDDALELHPSMPAGTIHLDRNERYAATDVLVSDESYVQPKVWYRAHLCDGARATVKRQDVPGYDPIRYVSDRIWVDSADGTALPVTLVRRADVALDGTAPCLMYGYGAYEYCFEPEFDPALISLLDQRVVFAHAHVRGGGEGGRRWWLDGRLEHKQHTFTDHLAAADALADGFVDGSRIATRGLSAGGLLQGAVFSQRPARWRAVVAEVPFVDVVTTMLDESVPLTAGEWEEWGDPRSEADFGWLLAYSPYDNLPSAGGRPDLLVTGALHDARVMVWEPAKWVAALRASDPHWSPCCLFRCELGAGAHAGPSGRYAALHYEAEVFAWLLERLLPECAA